MLDYKNTILTTPGRSSTHDDALSQSEGVQITEPYF